MASRTATLHPKRKTPTRAAKHRGDEKPQPIRATHGIAREIRREASTHDPRRGKPVLVNKVDKSPAAVDDRFCKLFDNAYEGMFQTTPEGRYLRVNRALARMYGYANPEDLIAAVSDIGAAVYVNPSRRDEFKRLIEQHGSVEGFEYQVRRRDGKTIWLSERAWAIRDPRNRIISYDGAVEDVTDRKRSELERHVTNDIMRAVSTTENLDDLLRNVHQALKKVVSAENCFIALHQESGNFEFPFFCDHFDPQPEPTPLGHGCADYIFRTGRPALIPESRFEDLMRQGEVELKGTPSRSWLGVPLKTPQATIGVLVVQDYDTQDAYSERDLEFLDSIGGQIAMAIERKRAEDMLRASDVRLRVLIEQLPAVLWTTDRDMVFTSALGAGLARLDLTPNELLGASLAEYFGTDDGTYPPVAAHRRAILGEPVTFHLEWKGGSYACHAEPLRDANGNIEGAICTALDVTDRKQLEEQFRQAQKMEAIGRLAGGIAHDFNNLLMVIQGYGDLMVERLHARDPLRKNVEQIQTAAQRATSLTRQLLAFSRKQILAPKILEIQTVVKDMEDILRRLIGEDIELEVAAALSLGQVKADRSQIEQVVMNLAINARDAMPNGGRLVIETANVEIADNYSQPPAVVAPGKYVMLAVTDNGCGMDRETKNHIFEPFFTTKAQGKGTGLGLATVYGIVKQSGGYIWVYSEPGIGTTFKIYLPRVDEDVDSALADAEPGSAIIARGCEVVLLVEDERGVRELTREYLEMSGYRVLEATDGQTALDIAKAHAGPIHVLMTDVVMPGMSGRELAQKVLAISPEIKVLYMSGYADQAVVRHGILEAGAELLQKPFGLTTLASKIREVLANQPVS